MATYANSFFEENPKLKMFYNTLSATDKRNFMEHVLRSSMDGPVASNSEEVVNDLSMQNLLDGWDEFSNDETGGVKYYYYTQNEDGDLIYEYDYNNYNSLVQEVPVEDSENREIVTNDNGNQYYYDKYTQSITKIENKDKNVKNNIKRLHNRIDNLEEKLQFTDENDLNPSNPLQVKEKLILPTINEDSIVYMNNNFGNKEHPEINTEVNENAQNLKNEMKINKKDLMNVLEMTKNNIKEKIEEENSDVEVEGEVETENEIKEESNTTMKVLRIILIVIAVVGFSALGFIIYKQIVKSKGVALNTNTNTNFIQNNLF